MRLGACFRDTLPLLLLVTLIGGSPVAAQLDTSAANPYRALRYRYVGISGNRTIAAAGVPGDPQVAYIGAASGGLWKTIDGGWNWQPIFDDQPAQSIGAIVLAPSNPNIVYVGTGETFLIRPAHALGNGMYRSLDAGRTWTHIGLDKTARIGRVVVHPTNPDIAFACALGHGSGPQHERGVFRTKDGGVTWDHMLFINEDTGCSDLAMDPVNPAKLIAGFWQVTIKPIMFVPRM